MLDSRGFLDTYGHYKIAINVMNIESLLNAKTPEPDEGRDPPSPDPSRRPSTRSDTSMQSVYGPGTTRQASSSHLASHTRSRAPSDPMQGVQIYPSTPSEYAPSSSFNMQSAVSASSAPSSYWPHQYNEQSAMKSKPPHHDPQPSSSATASGSSVKPWKCNFVNCNKDFARRSDLVRHERIHKNDRPHACDTCGKQFIQRSALTVHKRVHSGEKPHECKECGKPFSDSSSLARHRRIHSGKRPYTCSWPDCSKDFTRRTTLTRHEKAHRDHTGQSGYQQNTDAGILGSAELHEGSDDEPSDGSSQSASERPGSAHRRESAPILHQDTASLALGNDGGYSPDPQHPALPAQSSYYRSHPAPHPHHHAAHYVEPPQHNPTQNAPQPNSESQHGGSGGYAHGYLPRYYEPQSTSRASHLTSDAQPDSRHSGAPYYDAETPIPPPAPQDRHPYNWQQR